jgi:hypothetical protein
LIHSVLDSRAKPFYSLPIFGTRLATIAIPLAASPNTVRHARAINNLHPFATSSPCHVSNGVDGNSVSLTEVSCQN